MHRAHGAVNSALDEFQQQWAGLHPLAQARRREALAMLQPLTEIQVGRSSCYLSEDLCGGHPTVAYTNTNYDECQGNSRCYGPASQHLQPAIRQPFCMTQRPVCLLSENDCSSRQAMVTLTRSSLDPQLAVVCQAQSDGLLLVMNRLVMNRLRLTAAWLSRLLVTRNVRPLTRPKRHVDTQNDRENLQPRTR